MAHPRVDAGTRATRPRGTTLLAAVPAAPLASRPLGGVPPGSGGELRRAVRAGALSHGPAPSSGRRPPTRLRRRRSSHSTACASASSSTGRRALRAARPALRPLVRRRRPRHRLLRRSPCEDAAGPIVELGAGSGRIAVELARHGHDVIALDAAPAMLAQAASGARSASAWPTARAHARRPPRPAAAARERPRPRAVPHVHAPVGRRRAPARR